MPRWLIDGGGNVWSAHSLELRRTMWSRLPTNEFFQYVTENMGFAGVAQRPTGLQVRWRPTFTTKATLASLIQHVDDRGETRVAVKTFEDDRENYAVYGSIDLARNAILKTFDTARCLTGGFFRARILPQEQPEGSTPLAPLVEALRRACYRFEPGSLWSILNDFGGRRYILTENIDSRLRIIAWGNGYANFDTALTAQSIGKDFEEQADVAYARAAAAAYYSVAETGVSRLEAVEASTWRPGHGRSMVRYTRIIAPLVLTGDRALILSSATMR